MFALYYRIATVCPKSTEESSRNSEVVGRVNLIWFDAANCTTCTTLHHFLYLRVEVVRVTISTVRCAKWCSVVQVVQIDATRLIAAAAQRHVEARLIATSSLSSTRRRVILSQTLKSVSPASVPRSSRMF